MKLNFINCKFINFTVRSLGGIVYATAQSTVKFDNCYFDNIAANAGSLVYVSSKKTQNDRNTVSITNCDINNCRATAQASNMGGGLIYGAYSKSIEISNSNITNVSAGGNGGVIVCDYAIGTVSLSNSNFTNVNSYISGELLNILTLLLL